MMLPLERQFFGLVLIVTLSAGTVLSFSHANFSQEFLRQQRAIDVIYDTSVPCSSGLLNVCIGCKTYRICTGQPNDEDNPQEMCPDDNPYCEILSGECSSVPDNSVTQCEDPIEPTTPPPQNTNRIPAFKCTGVGKFPDPYNCAKYYYCEKEGVDGVSYDCQPDYSYNVTSQECQMMDSGCNPINCADSEYIFNEYPTDSQYFYYCKLDGGPNLPAVYMFSCGNGATFDVCTEQCVFGCTREGLFAKSSNPNKFYQCYTENDVLMYVERTCPFKSQVFNEQVQFCMYPIY